MITTTFARPYNNTALIDLDNAAAVMRLYLETKGIENPHFRVLSAKINDLFDEIDVTIRSLSPVPDCIEPEATFYIDRSFWLWAESQIELEAELFAVA